MSEQGAVELVQQAIRDFSSDHGGKIFVSTAEERARQHDADDARRDEELEAMRAKDDFYEATARAVEEHSARAIKREAVLKQAREALKVASRDKTAAASTLRAADAALAAIDALEVRS